MKKYIQTNNKYIYTLQILLGPNLTCMITCVYSHCFVIHIHTSNMFQHMLTRHGFRTMLRDEAAKVLFCVKHGHSIMKEYSGTTTHTYIIYNIW